MEREEYSAVNLSSEPCTLDDCFTQFSHCYPFRAYFYTPGDLRIANIHLPENVTLIPITQTLYHGDYRTYDTTNACVFVLFIQVLGPGSDLVLSRLPHWTGNGRNHIIAVTEGIEYLDLNAFKRHSHAILASHTWEINQHYRHEFDIHIPLVSIHANETTNYKPPNFDNRKYVLLYPYLDGRKWTGPNIEAALKELTFIKNQDNKKRFPIHIYNPVPYEVLKQSSLASQGNVNSLSDSDVIKLMGQSHFLLLFTSYLEANQFYLLLKEALKGATIPVFIGWKYRLPLEDLIEWKRISLTWPLHR